MSQQIQIVPCELDEANAFIAEHHRHHGKAIGHKFSIAAAVGTEVIGVCVVGRPVARLLQDGFTLEVVRLATNGTKNACSCLYAAAWRAARAMGYQRVVTYVLNTETGVSVQAAGWRLVGEAGGGTWDRATRPRVDKHPTQRKFRWEMATSDYHEPLARTPIQGEPDEH